MRNRLGHLMTSLLPTKPPASLGLVLDIAPLDLLSHRQNPDWNSDFHFRISLLEAKQCLRQSVFLLRHKNSMEEVKDRPLSPRPGQSAIFLRLSGPALINPSVYKALL